MKKIEFFTTIPGLASACPITPARSYAPSWAHAMREDYKRQSKGRIDRINHTYRCPGIFDLLRTGYLISMPWDIIIETNGDPWNFKWTVPDGTLSELMNEVPLVQSHSEAAKMLPTPPGAMSTIIKLNTPWHLKAPKDLKFLILPLSYTDEFAYEHVPGVLDPALSVEINLLLRWYKTDGVFKIKAGTPLAHIIPLSGEQYELVCRDADTWDKLWLQKRKFLNNFSFVLRKNKIIEGYNDHYYGKHNQ